VVGTAGVEPGLAGRAGGDAEVLLDGEFGSAGATQHRRLPAAVDGPPLGVVVGDFGVTPVTGVVGVTAGKPDGDDVALGPVVGTPGLVVDVDAADRVAVDLHGGGCRPGRKKHAGVPHPSPVSVPRTVTDVPRRRSAASRSR
jgi:hypothetical protein